MLAALAFVLLALGSVFRVADITTSVLAGLCIFIVELKYRTFRALAVYLVTAVLAVLLLPVSRTVLIFVCFSGVYSALKRSVEIRFVRPFQQIAKLLLFTALYTAFAALAENLLNFALQGTVLKVGAFLVVGAAFFAADFVMSRLMTSGVLLTLLTNNRR